MPNSGMILRSERTFALYPLILSNSGHGALISLWENYKETIHSDLLTAKSNLSFNLRIILRVFTAHAPLLQRGYSSGSIAAAGN